MQKTGRFTAPKSPNCPIVKADPGRSGMLFGCSTTVPLPSSAKFASPV